MLKLWFQDQYTRQQKKSRMKLFSKIKNAKNITSNPSKFEPEKKRMIF